MLLKRSNWSSLRVLSSANEFSDIKRLFPPRASLYLRGGCHCLPLLSLSSFLLLPPLPSLSPPLPSPLPPGNQHITIPQAPAGFVRRSFVLQGSLNPVEIVKSKRAEARNDSLGDSQSWDEEALGREEPLESPRIGFQSD